MSTSVVPQAVERAIERAVEFLSRRQLPSGQFPVENTLRDRATGTLAIQTDNSPFATAHIVYSLGYTTQPECRAMIARALDFLRSEQQGPGVWRHWSKASPKHAFIPPDADDTACISHLFARHGQAPDNVRLLLFNREASGLFYTWFIPRAKFGGTLRYWQFLLGDLNAGRAFGFWKRTSARRDDVDCVVNANVLLYLGERPETRAVVDYLLRILDSGAEATCDKWYHDPSVFWYAVSRAYAAGVVSLGDGQEVILRRIAERERPTAENDLRTALHACSFLNFRQQNPALESAIEYLVSAQQHDGGWASSPFYGGPAMASVWGSRELTTGFCVEALSRYEVPGSQRA